MKSMPLSIRIAGCFLATVVAAGLFGPFLAPYGFDDQNLVLRLRPPIGLGGSSAHLLGTDELGRDILSRLLYSIRISLLSALCGTIVAAIIGTTIGSVAALRKGVVGDTLMMLVDIQASIPFFILAIAIFAFFGNSMVVFAVIMSLNGWEVYARVSRGLTLVEQAKDYVLAVRLLGAPRARIYLKHILPNILGVLFVKMTLNFPGSILLESGLSFLGLGVQPPLTSLGLMVGTGREFLLFAWWVAVIPGIVIFLTTLCVSLLGDWLRDWIDPKQQ
ncbi:ABC transporter permease subunit [Sinorhizobium medicae]|nr:ABC transporter permease subunit [Sinorhizobium medicae]